MRAPTLAEVLRSLPPEGAQFALGGGPSRERSPTLRGPDDDPIPIGEPDDDEGFDDEDEEDEDEEDDYDED